MQQFPVGTQVALLRQLILIDTAGDLIATPLTESLQIRVYHAITPGPPFVNFINGPSCHDQDFFEFSLSLRRLFAHSMGGLVPVRPGEMEYPTFSTHGFDPFEPGSPEHEKGVILDRCPACHGDSGIHSVQSRIQWMQHSPPAALSESVAAVDPVAWETDVTIRRKQRERNFQLLKTLSREP